MELYIIIGVVIIAIVFAILIKIPNASEKRKVFKNNVYSYKAKSLVMTPVEADFFLKLDQCVRERYYVFPQVHLSSLLDHTIKGQDWSYAFRHINGKSVDFVLCDKQTLRPTYAIELDDLTHERPDCHERDVEVERIFEEAGLPLVRIDDKDIAEADIIKALMKVKSLSSYSS